MSECPSSPNPSEVPEAALERYFQDANFNRLVNFFFHAMTNGEMKVADIRSATDVAELKFQQHERNKLEHLPYSRETGDPPGRNDPR